MSCTTNSTEAATFSLCSLNRYESTESLVKLDPVALTSYLNDLVASECRLPEDKLVIRVYQGGDTSQQAIALLEAWMIWLNKKKSILTERGIIVDWQMVTCKKVRELEFTEKDLVDWLLDSHVHFILAHIHQGIVSLGWDFDVLYRQQLPRLYYHPGFPTRNQLFCPVFTQNKFQYLCALSACNFANPTLKIPLSLIEHEGMQLEIDR